MAQPIGCDICGQEQAVQMLSNMETGETIAMGPACLPVFYGHSVLQLLEAGDHKGPASKCQACRRFHEGMTTPVAPIGAAPEAAPDLEHPSTNVEQGAGSA